MKVSVYDIEETLFEGDAEKVIAVTTTGEITVLPGHIPLISVLRKAPLKVVHDGKETDINVRSGIIEVRPNDKAKQDSNPTARSEGTRVVVLVSDIY